MREKGFTVTFTTDKIDEAVRSAMTLLIQKHNEAIGSKAFADFCDTFNPGGSLDWDSIVENVKK